ncbi:MAG: putative DNA-binding domain-containing protein [Halioglobus sp.]
MAESALRSSQLHMARYLRDPKREEPPAGVEPRRLKIYEDLVYNNIESFISSGFPVLHSLYEPADWEALVRGFMQRHRSHSPYFLEISQEFLQFLIRDHVTRPGGSALYRRTRAL